MYQRVAIIGVGYTPFRPVSADLSFRELIFEAAQKAYLDAGIHPREVETFVSISEDFMEGTAIFDEYVPDQLGAVLKPVHTITADGITALASTYLQIKTGKFRIAVLEGHSKVSNIRYPSHIEALALDPIFVRPLGLNPRFIAGLDMNAYLSLTGIGEEDIAMVAEKNRNNALRNPRAAYPSSLDFLDVLNSDYVARPLKELEIAGNADGAIVLVLASEDVARSLSDRPIFINGIGWAEDTPNLDKWNWGIAHYAEIAGAMAYEMAGIKSPRDEIDVAEVDDTFAYKELQHLEALGFAEIGESAHLLHEGYFDMDGMLPVNPSGGNLGCGYSYDLAGLRAVAEIVLQLRGEAGEHQVEDVGIGLAQSWRGLPTAMGGVVILSNE